MLNALVGIGLIFSELMSTVAYKPRLAVASPSHLHLPEVSEDEA